MKPEPFPRAPEPTPDELRAHYARRQALLAAKQVQIEHKQDAPVLGWQPTLKQLLRRLR